MAVYCEAETEHSRKLCVKHSDFLMLNLLGKCPKSKDVGVKTLFGSAPDFFFGWARGGPSCVWVGTAVWQKSVYVCNILTNCTKKCIYEMRMRAE
jgi:hypothetical protein